jgi:hypothetical protein
LTAFQAYSEQLGNIQNFESQWPTPNADDYFQVELEQLVQTIQKLSRIMAGQDLKEDDKAFFSNELAASQSRINRALVDLRNHTTLSSLSIVRFSIHQAASIYINLALRDIVAAAEMHHIMVKRLKHILEHGGNEIILTWSDNLEALLWTAFIGGAAATYWPERKFFVNIILQVRNCFLILSLEQFRDTLKHFAWLDKFCLSHSRALWNNKEDPPWMEDSLLKTRC